MGLATKIRTVLTAGEIKQAFRDNHTHANRQLLEDRHPANRFELNKVLL